MNWWSIKDKNLRAEAKRKDEERLEQARQQISDTPPVVVKTTGDCIGQCGDWHYRTKRERHLARVAVDSGLKPSRLVEVVETDSGLALRGASNNLYPVFLENVYVFRASYKSAVRIEKKIGDIVGENGKTQSAGNND